MNHTINVAFQIEGSNPTRRYVCHIHTSGTPYLSHIHYEFMGQILLIVAEVAYFCT